MRRKSKTATDPAPGNDVDAALGAMDAEALRGLVRDMLPQLDDRTHGRVVSSIVSRAAHSGSGWAPAPLCDEEVSEVLAFAEAARRGGYADPSDVDERLRRGTGAFLRRDYAAAHRIFGALLPPIAEVEIDLGQHEMIDEVLGIEVNECAAQYLLSGYMTSPPERRAEAIRAAIDELRGAAYFSEPIREMERVAVEPLPGLAEFLPQWRAIVAKEAKGERRNEWDTEADRWLREVVLRIEGPGGLGKVARATKRADDLRAWCRSLAEGGDWESALAAFEEAAELVADRQYTRGEFLDGAALAAQETGNRDLSPWLERAWRAEPSMPRLRRWLGAAPSKATLLERASEALCAASVQAHRQRGFLHLLLGEFELAAGLLATAPGLGWSDREHPGHLVFPVFQLLLGNAQSGTLAGQEWGIEELDSPPLAPDEPHLALPEVEAILQKAGIEAIGDSGARQAVLAAMRQAAEKRVSGVTGNGRRRHYGHAASLVATCMACDRSSESARWAATVRAEHRRYPALRAELDRHLGRP